MSSLAEKRVYGESSGPTVLALACPIGVATVAVADDRIGEFGLALRCDARDLTVAPASATGHTVDPVLAVATPDDVLLAETTADAAGEADGAEQSVSGADLTAEQTGFGPAVAVSGTTATAGADGTAGSLLAAGPDGRIARRADGSWADVVRLPAVAALDGALAATGDGVWALRDGEPPERTALPDQRVVDVTAGVPLAATADGLYDLGGSAATASGSAPRLLEGSFRAVASTSGDEAVAASGRAHAATADALFARDSVDGSWSTVGLPVAEAVADVAYGAGSGAGESHAPDVTYAVTVDGTLLVDAGDGWRSRALGLRDVRTVAVVG